MAQLAHWCGCSPAISSAPTVPASGSTAAAASATSTGGKAEWRDTSVVVATLGVGLFDDAGDGSSAAVPDGASLAIGLAAGGAAFAGSACCNETGEARAGAGAAGGLCCGSMAMTAGGGGGIGGAGAGIGATTAGFGRTVERPSSSRSSSVRV
eukprot:812925-Prymnesium_polylepis.1